MKADPANNDRARDRNSREAIALPEDRLFKTTLNRGQWQSVHKLTQSCTGARQLRRNAKPKSVHTLGVNLMGVNKAKGKLCHVAMGRRL